MKLKDKVNYLKQHHFVLWLETKRVKFVNLSDTQAMFCCCGKLATSLHEHSCKKFNAKVDEATVEELSYLINE